VKALAYATFTDVRSATRTVPPAEDVRPAGARAADGIESAAADTPTSGVVEPEDGGRQWPLGLRTTRSRLVASYLVLLVVAGAAATFALRELLVIRLDDRVNDDLRQEVAEIQNLAQRGRDPQTAEPFTSLDRVYDVFFGRNVPGQDEALVAFVGGRFHHQNVQEFPLGDLPGHALERFRVFSRSGRSGEQLTGNFDTVRGEARFRAVIVRAESQTGTEEGAFVVAILPTTERAEIRELQLYAAAITVLVVLIAAAAAWFLAGRVVAPVNELTETARSISESELGRRIRVRGTDEVANMARTFNAMLDRLEAVYRSQREFLRAAGHEFRTPLTVAIGHLELLADGATSEERDATVALVLDELRRMGRVTDDLQALAEAERADFLAPQQVDLLELADQLITKASALGERDWQLDEVADGTFVADRARITQAVLNLADNAVKNTEEGGTIAIGIGIRLADIHIWVRDTGVGIPEKERERILDRFVRGEDAGRRYRGAGLGLAIVKTVAEAHGGSVTVESRPGEGSRFTMVLPRRPKWRES
jgi:two-component system, OmpR family, sensor kinase